MKRNVFILKTALCTGKFQLFLILGVNLIQGIVLSLEILVWQQLVDGIMYCLDVFLFEKILIPICYYMVLAFVNLLLLQVSGFLNWKYSAQITNYVNNELLCKCAHISYSVYHDSKFYDELMRINEESAASIVRIVTGSATLVQYAMAYVSAFVILARYSILIPVTVSVLMLPMLMYELCYSKKLYDVKCRNTEESRMVEKLSAFFFSYRNIMEIRTYGIAKPLIDKVRNFQKKRYDEEKEVRRKQLKGEVYINSGYIFCVYLLKLFAIVVSVHKAFTPGVITMYITSIDQVSADLQCIISSLSEWKVDRLYIESLQDFLLRDEETFGQKKAGKIREVRFENVSYRYPGAEKNVLENVSFCLKTPDKCLLQGPNGCGKSTLIKLLAGFYRPDAGKIFINGIDIQELDRKDYYNHLCIMYQEYNRYPLSVRENITFQENIRGEDVHSLLEMVQMSDDMKKIKNGMDTIADNEQKDGTELSLGQWQKLAFCRAVYHGGDFLICDEPTASVDAATSRIIQDELLGRNRDKLVFFISHDEVENINITHKMIIHNGHIEVEKRG